MFKAEDFVQSKTGGPKMQVLRVEGDTLWCARVDDAAKKEIEVKAESVNLYHEEGALACAEVKRPLTGPDCQGLSC